MFTSYVFGKTPTYSEVYSIRKPYAIKKVSTNKNASVNAWSRKRLREELNAHLRENASK